MSSVLADRWFTLQSDLQSGTVCLVDAFDQTFDSLTCLASEQPQLADELIETLPTRCATWPHSEAIRLGVACAASDRRRWGGDFEAHLSFWRDGVAQLPKFRSATLTTVYLSHLCGQLLNYGRVVDGLQACNDGLAALRLGPHEKAEMRLRIHAASGMMLLGEYDKAIELAKRAETLLVSKPIPDWPGRKGNLVVLAHAIYEREAERLAELGHCSTDNCYAGRKVAKLAVDLFLADKDRRVRTTAISALHTWARLSLLSGNTDDAQAAYRQIDERFLADPSIRSLGRMTAAGRSKLELSRGRPEAAASLLDEAYEPLASERDDLPMLDWWQVRGEVLVALGRWQEAHDAQINYMRTWRAMSRQRAQAWAEVVQRRLDFNNASALQFLSHDLRAPLDSMVAVAKGSPDGGSPETMQRLSTLAERASHIASRSIDYMRALLAEEADFQLLDLTTVLDDACEDTEALGADKFVRLQRDLKGPAWVLGDQDLLRRAFANLLTNAIRHAPAGSAVTVTLHAAGSEAWHVSVADLGPGFDAEQIKFLHAQTHPSPSGHGLGLAFVSRALAKHDATLKVERNTPRGALVQMQFHAAAALPGNACACDYRSSTRASRSPT